MRKRRNRQHIVREYARNARGWSAEKTESIPAKRAKKANKKMLHRKWGITLRDLRLGTPTGKGCDDSKLIYCHSPEKPIAPENRTEHIHPHSSQHRMGGEGGGRGRDRKLQITAAAAVTVTLSARARFHGFGGCNKANKRCIRRCTFFSDTARDSS